jgi:hypothetical protein
VSFLKHLPLSVLDIHPIDLSLTSPEGSRARVWAQRVFVPDKRHEEKSPWSCLLRVTHGPVASTLFSPLGLFTDMPHLLGSWQSYISLPCS